MDIHYSYSYLVTSDFGMSIQLFIVQDGHSDSLKVKIRMCIQDLNVQDGHLDFQLPQPPLVLYVHAGFESKNSNVHSGIECPGWTFRFLSSHLQFCLSMQDLKVKTRYDILQSQALFRRDKQNLTKDVFSLSLSIKNKKVLK